MPFAFSKGLLDQFNLPKLIVLYLTAFFLIFHASFSRIKLEVGLNRRLFVILLVCTCTFFVSQLFYLVGSYRVVNYEFFCLFIILLFSAALYRSDRLFLTKMSFFNFLSLTPIVCLVVYRLINNEEGFLELFFGNRNHFAEFLGFSVLFQICEHKSIVSNFKVPRLAHAFVTASTLILCVYTFCRSVLLALLVCGVCYIIKTILYPRFKNKLLNLRHFIVGLFLIGTACIFTRIAYNNYLASTDFIFANKKLSSQLRVSRWLNTIEMFKAHPLGFGPDSYEFSYLDYKSKVFNDPELTETKLIRSPHNGYLELFVEYGALVGLLFVVLLATTLFKFWSLKNSTFFMFILFGGVDAFFAFPVELPFPSFILTLILGAGLAEIDASLSRISFNVNKFARIVLIPFFVSTILVISSQLTSAMLEGKRGSEFFCAWTPSIWRNCIDSARKELSQNHFEKAKEVLAGYLNLYPNNFLALKYYAFTLGKLGETKEACVALKRYNLLFPGKFSIEKILTDQCNGE